METEKKFIRIGKISKAKGLKGHINAFVDPDFVWRLKKVDVLYLNLKENKIPYFVDKYEMSDSGHSLFLLEGIDDRTKAEALHGKEIFTEESNLKKANKYDSLEYLIGYKVIDEYLGALGIVNEVYDTPSTHAMIQINFRDKQVMIPLVEEYNLNINNRNKTITLLMPDGMLDL